jgi:hypothetical protein
MWDNLRCNTDVERLIELKRGRNTDENDWEVRTFGALRRILVRESKSWMEKSYLVKGDDVVKKDFVFRRRAGRFSGKH